MSISISDINTDIKESRKSELNLRKFELEELKKVKYLIDDDQWDNVDFVINLKNSEKLNISKYNFNDCIDQEIILAIKKLIKAGFTKAIKNREEIIKKLEEL